MRRPVKIIVPAHTDHIFWIANNMRQADRDEIAAAAGKGPWAALRDSLHLSVAAWTGLVDDEPICMFGVVPLDILGGVGSPWLLGTDEIEKHAISFLRLNKQYVKEMLEYFPYLVNFVDARNKMSIQWLKWLGFKFDSSPIPYGIWNLPFYRFSKEKI